VACQLQEQEDFEQEQHDAEVAQRISENDDSSSRQNRGRVDQLRNVLQDIERSSPSPTCLVIFTSLVGLGLDLSMSCNIYPTSRTWTRPLNVL
jgi:thymidylate synthase